MNGSCERMDSQTEWYHESARGIIRSAVLLSSKLLADEAFAHAFPTRDTQDAELCAHLGTDLVVQVRQVHGGRSVEADAPPGTEADAVVARKVRAPPRQSIAVGVRVADCVPLLLADPKAGNVAAVHVGWRGLVAQVVPAAVEALAAAAPLAAIGPCIGPCCFEVGRDVAALIARACAGGERLVRDAGDKTFVDLRAAVRAQLRAIGVADANIEDVPGCTRHDAPRFHSYRRDGASSGRMLAAIATRR
jgi:purine-nucleoside/S-methyl-5'-thioadenosine phosphorylase / adenosine deaminase